MSLQVSVVREDVTSVDVDVLLLKHAQGFYGADEAVALRLTQEGACGEGDINPLPGDFRLIETKEVIPARNVLFVGTPSLRELRYVQIRQFAQKAIEAVARLKPSAQTLATTVHGAGYGLDIEEAQRSLILGFQQGLTRHPLPKLKQLLFVERNARRYEVLKAGLADVELVMPATNESPAVLDTSAPVVVAERKKSVFVAMPFSEEFEDVYQFGIYAVVRKLGYVCEKVDESVYTGSIVERITEGIRNASLVIADLSLERPNVYLEVGFAWGLKKPVILVARQGQKLHFDLSHHKCLFYSNIVKLSEALEKTIREFAGADLPERGGA